MNIENRVIEVSNDGKNWSKRVLICIKNDTAICWFKAESLGAAAIEKCTSCWNYWREIPEPKYRPFTWEDRDLIKGKWIRPKSGVKDERLIINLYKTTDGDLFIHNGYTSLHADKLLDDYEFADGTPCGKLVE